MRVLWYTMGMTTKTYPKKRIACWEFVLLGSVPTFLGALSLATYLLGRDWNRLLLDALVSAGVLTFVSCLFFALFRFVSLCRERRRAMACSGIALYVASASTVVVGMLYAVLGRH